MSKPNVNVGRQILMRDAGLHERWLQEVIANDPSVLGLGELEYVDREIRQPTGGRLDLLFRNPEDNAMYEVEVMLGDTDPEHIIRTIEYWDVEKRRYPKRQHTAVLVAESFNRRYFNVVQLLSLSIPMVAIQVGLVRTDDQYTLHFTKVLDIYEEPEDEPGPVVNERTWEEEAPWALEIARKLFSLLPNKEELTLRFTQRYISILSDVRLYNISKRAHPRALLYFTVRDQDQIEAIADVLDNSPVGYTYSDRYHEFLIRIDLKKLMENEAVFRKIHEIRFPQL